MRFGYGTSIVSERFVDKLEHTIGQGDYGCATRQTERVRHGGFGSRRLEDALYGFKNRHVIRLWVESSSDSHINSLGINSGFSQVKMHAAGSAYKK